MAHVEYCVSNDDKKATQRTNANCPTYSHGKAERTYRQHNNTIRTTSTILRGTLTSALGSGSWQCSRAVEPWKNFSGVQNYVSSETSEICETYKTFETFETCGNGESREKTGKSKVVRQNHPEREKDRYPPDKHSATDHVGVNQSNA